MPKQKNNQIIQHTPVMVQEVLGCLSPKLGQGYLDLTAGYGGHAAAILAVAKAPKRAVLVDRDERAIKSLSEQFANSGANIIHSDYLSALKTLEAQEQRFDNILADLGVSSLHLQEAERGFSFNKPGPLDMRMDQRQELTAGHLVNSLDETELAWLLQEYGQEPRAKSIARAIINNRPFKDTKRLAEVIAKAAGWRGRHGKINPATRSFQAIRIAVNNELAQLEQSLPIMARLLAPGGRMAIISFHSLEDRIVKNFLAEQAGETYDADLRLLTKKPITPSQNEIVLNPRARSAKLRAAAKK